MRKLGDNTGFVGGRRRFRGGAESPQRRIKKADQNQQAKKPLKGPPTRGHNQAKASGGDRGFLEKDARGNWLESGHKQKTLLHVELLGIEGCPEGDGENQEEARGATINLAV